MLRKNLFILLLATATVEACVKNDKTPINTRPEGSLGNNSYLVVENSTLERTESQISGTGSVVFISPLEGTFAKSNVQLNFAMEDGGSLELVVHSDSNLAKGLSLIFKRKGTTLILQPKAEGIEGRARELRDINASEIIEVFVDIHNNENPAHLLVWKAGNSAFTEEDALYNSNVDNDTPNQGNGLAWGLVLIKAAVSAAHLEEAKFNE